MDKGCEPQQQARAATLTTTTKKDSAIGKKKSEEWAYGCRQNYENEPVHHPKRWIYSAYSSALKVVSSLVRAQVLRYRYHRVSLFLFWAWSFFQVLRGSIETTDIFDVFCFGLLALPTLRGYF